MVEVSVPFPPSARGIVLRKASLCMAVAATAAQFFLPVVAMAQATPANAAQPTCDALPLSGEVTIALSTSTRLEPSAGPVGGTKANAILGGAMSKLEQMRTVQATGQALLSTNMTTMLATQAPLLSSACAETAAELSVNAVNTPAVYRSDAILGTQSVTVVRTPFDRDWAAVQMRPNNTRVQHALSKSGARGSSDKLQQLQIVNRWINRNIAFGEDQAVYRRPDYWAPASETLGRGIGDCEDFAIAKMELLAALGFARQDMRLIIARDLVRNADHAVLFVKVGGGSVMLDNATDRLLDGHLPNDYRPIMSFSQNAKWVHGYAAPQPTIVRLAALPPTVVPASRRAAEVLTVTADLDLPALSVAWLSAPLVPPTLL